MPSSWLDGGAFPGAINGVLLDKNRCNRFKGHGYLNGHPITDAALDAARMIGFRAHVSRIRLKDIIVH